MWTHTGSPYNHYVHGPATDRVLFIRTGLFLKSEISEHVMN